MRWPALLVVLLVAALRRVEPSRRSGNSPFPTAMLGYTYSGGTTRPIANTGTGIVNGSSLQSAY